MSTSKLIQAAEWEVVLEHYDHAVRRLVVPTGWIYQTQDGRRYHSAPGTIGRERDLGEPIWGPLVFVPLGAADRAAKAGC